MTIQTLTAHQAIAVKEGLRRTLDQLVERMAPTPGPLREAIRYELAWAMRREADRVIEAHATRTVPESDERTPPGYWEGVSSHMAASPEAQHRASEAHVAALMAAPVSAEARAALARGLASARGALPIALDLSDAADDTLTDLAQGTPTDIPPLTRWCDRCRQPIPEGSATIVMDGGLVCATCRDQEWGR